MKKLFLIIILIGLLGIGCNLTENVQEDKVGVSVERGYLVGSWHASKSVSAGYAERYIFYENGKYVFFYSQYDTEKKYFAQSGLWRIEKDKLILDINKNYINSKKIQKIDEEKHLEIRKVTSQDDSPYKEKILLGENHFWKISKDTDLWTVEAVDIDKK